MLVGKEFPYLTSTLKQKTAAGDMVISRCNHKMAQQTTKFSAGPGLQDGIREHSNCNFYPTVGAADHKILRKSRYPLKLFSPEEFGNPKNLSGGGLRIRHP